VTAIPWLILAVFGVFCLLAGRRVLIDPDWESGDWWVLSSWVALRGAVFGFLFPVVRTEHTRAQERTNALWIILWGLVLVAIGLMMVMYER
jgi:hypothetical protein